MDRSATLVQAVRAFVNDAFVLGETSASELDDTSNLVELGIVDSLNVLRLVDFLEETFDFMLEPEELFRLTSVASIVDLVRHKTGR